MQSYTCRSSIVGAYYRPQVAKSILYNSDKGDVVTLYRDKENEFDSNAVKVVIKGHHVGYLGSSDAAVYGPAMDDQNLLCIHGVMIDPTEKYPRIQFDLPSAGDPKIVAAVKTFGGQDLNGTNPPRATASDPLGLRSR